MSERKGIKAEDLYELKSAVDPRLSPDGSLCVYVQTAIDQETDEYFSHIYFMDVSKKTKPVQWTSGKGRNHSPRWSPDGTSIAFVSSRTGKNQIYILSAHGGEAKQITFIENGASNPVWSPDGKRIAFSASAAGNKTILDKEEKKAEDKLLPLEVTKMKYKSDAEGFWKGNYKHIGVADVDSGDVVQLTEGPHDYQLYSWSPDGENIAIGADLEEDSDASFVQDVYLLQPKTKKLTKLTNGTGYFGNVTWSPDGQTLGIIGHEKEFHNATLPKLWIYQIESGVFTCFSEGSDIAAGDIVIGDFQQGAVTPGVLWADDSKSFYFLATDHGNTIVYYGSLDGEMYPALLDQQHVYGLALNGKDHQAVVAISKPSETGDLYLLNVSDGNLEKLTDINGDFLKGIEIADAEPFEFEGSDGWKINGWMIKPIGFEEGKKYPLIMEIHGGPHAMYGNSYMHEFQMLAAKGYAVLFTNPRGSHGYGQEFVNAVRGDYGGKDYQDLMDAVDYALDKYDFIDEDRLGVTGGSYGGFMTNWIVSHTNRFKAAVTQRSISNWISFYGVSDIGYYFTEWQIESDLSDIEKLWKHSPLAYVDKVDTPLLILHSERDYRCPIEQAEQLFIALKRLKKPTKFIRFPEENHELSRSGKPGLRVARLNYIADWFGQYLN
ncbi:S9 family peptidase [Neobacillus sp. PS3-34]|uniref:S9 family peptidase n=1 Tax=Neobacillus sp. PS3-34 TaxID=3070678 RepID=UPI0027E1FB58|nr:S9 family peptidase [Neobacillus sp. PS3-34]WML49631.1 S9 family peptidase [Neobacillus sp. PS3-34]